MRGRELPGGQLALMAASDRRSQRRAPAPLSRTEVFKRPGPHRRLLLIGAIYIIAVYVTYLLAGLGLIWFQGVLIKLGLSFYLGMIVGLILLFFGGLEIKDYFWYGRGFSLAIPGRFAAAIKERSSHVTGFGAVLLGIFVAMVELPCTGGPYLAITAILATQFDLLAFYYLLIYNVIFVLPLIIIVALAGLGVRYQRMKQWKDAEKKWMRLFAGLLLMAFGLFIIAYYAGAINVEYLASPTSGSVSLHTLTLPVVLVTAAVDSINPCAIGVLLLLIAALVSISRTERLKLQEKIQ